MSKKEIIDEPKKEIIEEPKKVYDGDLRGFKSLKEANDYINTPEFKKLDIGCRTEYVNWLKSILKED